MMAQARTQQSVKRANLEVAASSADTLILGSSGAY
jgi:hypothetical protein